MQVALPGVTPMSSPSARIADAEAARKFILAGDAYVTFVSTRTGTRFTYHVELAPLRPGDTRPRPHFVSVLTAPEHYEYLGMIFDAKAFAFGKKSRIGQDAPSAKAFLWVWRHLRDGAVPAECEIWHEGRCGRCGRRLTVPTSLLSGLGPECAKRDS
jgi:hypothetical protein